MKNSFSVYNLLPASNLINLHKLIMSTKYPGSKPEQTFKTFVCMTVEHMI